MISVLLPFAQFALSVVVEEEKTWLFFFHICPTSNRFSGPSSLFFFPLHTPVSWLGAVVCYSWALQTVLSVEEVPRPEPSTSSGLSLLHCFNTSPPLCVFSALCIWAKIRRSHWFDLPPQKEAGSCLCYIVPLFSPAALTADVSLQRTGCACGCMLPSCYFWHFMCA